MKQETYIFLDETIYRPDYQDDAMGEIVEITKRDGDEVWFTVLSTGKKGYVAYPDLFAENTTDNRTKMDTYKREMSEAKAKLYSANRILDSFDRVKF